MHSWVEPSIRAAEAFIAGSADEVVGSSDVPQRWSEHFTDYGAERLDTEKVSGYLAIKQPTHGSCSAACEQPVRNYQREFIEPDPA